MRRFVLPLVLFLLTAAPAGAVTYELEDVAYNQAAQNWSLLPAPTISITITPQAVASGSFDFHASTDSLTTSGDVSDLIAFRIGSDTLGPSGYGLLYSHLNISLSFDANGVVTSGSIDWLGSSNEFELSGDAADFGGSFSLSDSSYCGYNSNPIYACSMTGIFVDPPDPEPVPEPRSAALLLLPLLGMGWVLYRRPKRPSLRGAGR